MKMDFQKLLGLSFCLTFFAGCGEQQTTTATVVEAKASCVGNVIPQQYIVKHRDGSYSRVKAKSEEILFKALNKSQAEPVEYVEHDFYVKAMLPVSAQSSEEPQILADNWGAVTVQADALWAQEIRGDGIPVAVIDSGMDINHPQLRDQLFLNSGEAGLDAQGKDKINNGIDDDQNGYIDDHAGYDFVPAQPKPLTGDHHYHGTHVAGVVVAQHNDSVAGAKTYVQGIAPKAKVLPLAFLDSKGHGEISRAVLAIRYAAQRGVRVINASWGGEDCSQSLKEVIAALAEQHIVFVSAAGNEGSNVDRNLEYPASLNLASQLTIGATESHDLMASFSNYGAKVVHLFAPGTKIVSTFPNKKIWSLDGTSMAAPFVTGAVALLLGEVPTATPDQIRRALYNSAMHNSTYLNASRGRLALSQAIIELRRIVGPK